MHMEFRDILLLVNVTATDDVYPTLIQHAHEHHWRLTIEDRMAPPAGWRGHGAIVQAMDWPVVTRYVKSLVRRGIPVVNLINSPASGAIPSCIVDMRRVGKMAAAHFAERGFRHAAFFTMEWLHGRKIVSGSLAKAMKGCATELWAWPLEASESLVNNRSAMVKWLKGRLRGTPKPIAVLCPNAYNAVTLLNVCLDMGLSVPDEVAILSAHYDPAFCDCQSVPISGIEIDTRLQAQKAANMLDRLMDGDAKAPIQTTIAPTRIVVQQSTDVLATENPILRQAFRFIRDNISHPFGAAEIAASLNVPRIRLERLFAAQLRRSVGKEILRQRIARAKKMLDDTDATLATIASECGFCHASYLINAFKKATGVTPHHYRRRDADLDSCSPSRGPLPRGRALRNILSGAPSSPNRARMLRSMNAR